MSSQDRRSQDNCQTPDLSTIIAGTTPARWYSSNSRKWTVQAPKYVFAQSVSTELGSFNLNPPQTKESSKEQDESVVCELCPHACVIPVGKTGRCSARVNIDGSLVTRFYARPVSAAIDPIEKKPLYHFHPGSRVLSLGTRGCNLSCKFCQNWQISRPLPIESNVNQILTPEKVVELAVKENCPSVAFTYNEPTIWAEYVIDAARLCHKHGIKTVAVTNGMISGEARRDFYREIDAANIDLKSFSHSFYHNLTGGNLDCVKETLKYVFHETETWLEVTNLLIPGHNDTEAEVQEMCRWLVQELGTSVPLHFSAFFPAWRLTDVPRTPIPTLDKAFNIAKDTGLKFVYEGNVPNDKGQTTYCSKCGTALILRAGYCTTFPPELETNSQSLCCKNCGEPLPGVYR